MILPDLDPIRRLRDLRRDKAAAKLKSARADFAPVDRSLAEAERRLGETRTDEQAAIAVLGATVSVTYRQIVDLVDDVARCRASAEAISAEADELHGRRITLLSAVRKSRDEWRECENSCRKWAEFMQIVAERAQNEALSAEENASSEAVFYVNSRPIGNH